MVAIRSFFIVYAAAGLASAGKCKPESLSSSIISVPSSTFSSIDTASTDSTSAILIESTTTTMAETTRETSLTDSTTETAFTTDVTETAPIAIKDDTTQILEEIAKLQARLPETTAAPNNYVLQKFLEDMATYTGTTLDVDEGLSDRASSKAL
ncbi:chitin synthase a [Fusarium langsethiae]|uniref:Chitin synthase a n=1 Tax=Fusarium langsethiae TaxID=179993 RepID=A0A0N1J258_FUSLA|nr:chitin synthase a [Fusarium langsethiae]